MTPATLSAFHFPWRIEGRATPFSAWAPIARVTTIEEAARRLPDIKRQQRLYAVRIRAV